MDFPKDLKYTKDHEWVRISGDTGVVGITDYAQGELGDIVFVELPAKGKKVKQGESMGTIEAVKAVSDLYAPLTGEVVEVNPELEKNSEVINKEPYGKGWMVKIRMTSKDEAAALLDDAAYRALVGK
jgi:glycine cleavage system H protein